MESSRSQYRSYLLRLWRSGDGKTWRAMVEEIGSHETHHFADLEELCAFLRKQTEDDTRTSRTHAASGL